MKLFLASSGLSGLRSFVDSGVSAPRLGFVSAAATPFVQRDWIERDRLALSALGFSVSELELESDTSALEDAMSALDVVFVAGGNTYYLLQEIQASGFAAVLPSFLKAGGIYAGSSAGAIVAGPNIATTAEPMQRDDAPGLASTEGLGLVDFCVLPHAGREDAHLLDHHNRVLHRSEYSGRVVRITDSEAVVVDGHEWQVVSSPA